MTHVATLAAAGMLMLPAHAHDVRVFDHGRRLIATPDPAADTCARQVAYVKSRRDLRIIAELVRCWGAEVDNFSHDRLVVKWSSRGVKS